MEHNLVVKAILLVGSVLMILFPTFSQFPDKPVEFSNRQEVLDLNNSISVYHLPDSISAQEVTQILASGTVQPIKSNTNPGMSFPNDNYWISFSVKNDLDETANFHVEIDFPQLDIVKLYKRSNPLVLIHATGDDLPFSERPVLSRKFILPIVLEEGENGNYLLLLEKKQSTVRFPMKLYHESLYLERNFFDNLSHAFYFGIIGLIVLAAFVIGFIVKDKTFLTYGFYIGTFGLWLFTWLGYTYQFITSDYPYLNKHVLPYLSQLGIVFLILYIQYFFDTRKHLKYFHIAMNVVQAIFIGGLVVWFFIPETYIAYGVKLLLFRYVLAGSILIFALVAAYTYRKVNAFRSYMFIGAYTFLFLAIISKTLSEYGLFDESRWPLEPILIGFLIEVVVLSIAMGFILKKTLDYKIELKVINDELNEKVDSINQRVEIAENQFITLNSKAVIELRDIKYIKSDDHYLEFYLSSSSHKEIDRNKISKVKELLPANFSQIHRSIIYCQFILCKSFLLQRGTHERW